ncbi:MAG: hypothetical protein EVJ46_00180 [Candidatus Acididesulfobacter guangdongensis]|uniref:Helix-turn-helix domain-containing protein n=1 Tax=Acididesulfobacter guangdongensis TaxID=2597225 RepID=A0A519BHF9_ACIG2|nr:MAG: hypothetical protein EVJ46_00180 [Candidatus Acididesulfobacter guangdongensis]
MEEKIIIENKIAAPFTWVENDLIRSKSLSLEVMGLYLLLRSFGGISYPSIQYLCEHGRVGRDKLYRVMNELIEAKLLLKKQQHKTAGKFSKTLYRILSLNDNYEEIYKEFIGEEPLNQQSIDNTQSQPCPEKPYTVKPYTVNPQLIRIKDKEESLKEKESHTQNDFVNPTAIKNVCEENNKNNSHTPSLKVLELFKNEDENVLFKIERQHKDAAIAGKYLDYQAKKGKIAVKNPCGLLIKTLKDGLFSDVDEIILQEQQKIANEKQKIVSEIKEREKEEEAEKLADEYIAKMPKDKKNNRIKEIIIENNYKDDDLGNVFAILKLKAEVSNMLNSENPNGP